jgi:hypothetical protein
MSIILVKEQVKKFLSTESAEVLAIKGSWGVGKTYSWELYVKEFKGDCALKSYSYVSLFGANSIDELKKSVFFNTIDVRNIGQSLSFKSRSKSWIEPLQGLKIKGIGLGEVLGSVSQLAMPNMIICFDDLERHSKGVTIKDFMGLVSYYKEQKGCKVVLLLNEEVGDETFDDYQKYKEKVVDKQLHFDPTAEDSFDTIYSGCGELKDFARHCCVSLDIKNKRIINKIKAHIDDSIGQLRGANFDLSIKEQIVCSIILLSLCYYSKGVQNKKIPSFEYVTSSNGLFDKYFDEEPVEGDEAKTWDNFLASYGFEYDNELVLELSTGIEKGFFDIEKLSILCHSKQNEIEIRKRSKKLIQAWDLYHNSFDLNDAEVIDAMEAGLKDVVEVASPSQYGSGILVLREIGGVGEIKADELIALFIEKRKGNPEVFDLDSFDSNPFGVRDTNFDEKLRAAHKAHTPSQTITQILEQRKGTSSYNQAEADIFDQLSESEIKKMFLGFKGKNLYDYVKVFILLSGSNESLRTKVDKALEDIATMSFLNKSRMGKFKR